MRRVGRILLGPLLAYATGCSTTILGGGGGGGTPDAGTVITLRDGGGGSGADASPVCTAPKLPASFGAVGQVTADLREDPSTFQLLLPVDQEAQPETLMINFDKANDPFGNLVAGSATFLFSGADASACQASSKVCAYLLVDSIDAPTGYYDIATGSLEVDFSTEPNPPSPGACEQHDGDLAGCDAAGGCAYFACSASCHASGTSLCNGGCLMSCGASGSLKAATFQDQDAPACTTTITSLSFTAPVM